MCDNEKMKHIYQRVFNHILGLSTCHKFLDRRMDGQGQM